MEATPNWVLRQKEWLDKYMSSLVGMSITKVENDIDEFNDVWTRITAVDEDGETFTLELSQDEEGNGPGFLFGLPSVTLESDGLGVQSEVEVR